MTRRTTVARVTSRALLIAGFAGGAWLLASSAAHAADVTAADVTAAASPTDRAEVSQGAPITGTALRLLDQVLATTNMVPGATATTSTMALIAPAVDPAAARHAQPQPADRPYASQPDESHRAPGTGVGGAAGSRGGVGGAAGSRGGTYLLRLISPVLHRLQPALGTGERGTVALADVLARITAELPTGPATTAGPLDSGLLGTGLLDSGLPDSITLDGGMLDGGMLRFGPEAGSISLDGVPDLARAALAASAPAPGPASQARHTAPARNTVTVAPAIRADRPTIAGPGTRQVPGHPEPAPLPAFPGSDNTGISTTVSGSHHDGGAFVAVPAPVAGGQMVAQHAPRANQVEVRLLLAEAPIFSPD